MAYIWFRVVVGQNEVSDREVRESLPLAYIDVTQDKEFVHLEGSSSPQMLLPQDSGLIAQQMNLIMFLDITVIWKNYRS